MIEKAIKALLYAWARGMQWFPQDPHAQVEIGARIRVWVGDERADWLKKIEWLQTSALAEMPEWKGLDALRQLFLARYRMPPGVERWDKERGTYYLDSPADTKLLGIARSVKLPAPNHQPGDEPFDQDAFLRETSEAMERSRESVPDLKQGDGKSKGAAA